MTHYSTGAVQGKRVAAHRRGAARRISKVCGLTLAVIAASVTYTVVIRAPGAHLGHALNPSSTATQPSARHQSVALRRRAEFTVAETTDSVVISPDGRVVIAVADDGSIKAWSTSTRRVLSNFNAIDDDIPPSLRLLSEPNFSPDGRTFSVMDSNTSIPDNAANIWDMATGRARFIPYALGSPSYATEVAPGPNGVLAVPLGNNVELEDLATAQTVDTLPIKDANVGDGLSAIVFSPDGRVIAISGSAAIYLWNTTGRRYGTTLPVSKLYNTMSDRVESIAFSHDSRTVACGSDSGIIRVWDVSTKRAISTFTVDGNDPSGSAARPVRTLVFSPDGKSLITADDADNTLSVWNVASGRKVGSFFSRSGNVASAAFTPAGVLMVVTIQDDSSGQRIMIWAASQILYKEPWLTTLLRRPDRLSNILVKIPDSGSSTASSPRLG